jgi:hypothetical protein
MKELTDTDYAKLVKDADDNRGVLFIVKCTMALVLIMVLYFTVGQRIVNTWFESYHERVKCEIAVMQARNDVLIREIQSEGMTTEEYLKWYEIYSQAS